MLHVACDAHVRAAPPPATVYVVNHLVKRRRVGSTWQYLVRWEGFTSASDTWEKESDILDDRLIECFISGEDWSEAERNASRPPPSRFVR